MRPTQFPIWTLLGTFAALLAPRLVLPAKSAEQTDAAFALVQVIVTRQSYDPFLPWQKGSPLIRQGYGVLVSPSRVITTESLIRHHTLVELRRARSGEKIPATVAMSDCQANLALLTFANGATLSDATPLEPARRVPRKANVEILQFDETQQIQRGDGRVVQISIRKLPQAPYPSLTFRILTDLNVSGLGAPVIHDGKLAGLMMSYDRGQRTGMMLPYPVLRRFLDDVARPPYRGFGSAGFIWAVLVDPAKRAFLGVREEGKGILVLSCLAGTGAHNVLNPNDVILKIGGQDIDNLGFYEDPEFGRLGLSYLIKGRQDPDDTIPMTIVRNQEIRTVNVRIARPSENSALIPENVEGRQAEYLVDGGFVIRELTGAYLRAHGSNWTRTVDSRLVHLYFTKKYAAQRPGERVVILSSVLPAPINIGYQSFKNAVIEKVNGERIQNMRDVFRLAKRDGHILRLSLQSFGVDLALEREKIEEANRRLAADYRIPALRHQAPEDDNQ